VAYWNVQLCDLSGFPISNLTPIATSRKLKVRMNRPSSLELVLPSWDAAVNSMHTDALPFVEPLARTIKAFRQETPPGGGTPTNVIRFAGIVWQVADEGDANGVAHTTLSAFAPMKRLERRRVYDGSGPSASDKLVVFTATDGAQVAKTIVDRSQTFRGSAGISTSGLGSVFETTPTRDLRWERKRVAPALVELTDAFNGFDLDFAPVDRTDGILAVMSAYSRLGATRQDVIFGWNVDPRNVKAIKRIQDGEQIANLLLGIGAGQQQADAILSEQTNAVSRSIYGVYEDVDEFGDVTNQTFLDALVQEEVAFRAKPRELVEVTPAQNAPPPWIDDDGITTWREGDSFYVYASESLRSGFAGLQRCYGFDLDISAEGVETVEKIYTAPEGT
jgi:hypothetical protein